MTFIERELVSEPAVQAVIGIGSLVSGLARPDSDIDAIISYSLLTQAIAQQAGLPLGYFSHTIIDAHIYVNHVDGLMLQLTRTPKPLPRLQIASKPLDELQFEDFTLIGTNAMSRSNSRSRCEDPHDRGARPQSRHRQRRRTPVAHL